MRLELSGEARRGTVTNVDVRCTLLLNAGFIIDFQHADTKKAQNICILGHLYYNSP